jgi:hypothetical protein
MPTLTIDGTLSFPLGGESDPPERPFKAQLNYDQKRDNEIALSGAQANVDLMAGMADAKACYIEVLAGTGALKVNGAATTLPVSVDGGFWVWFNPNGGLTALTVTTTDDAKFRVYLFT